MKENPNKKPWEPGTPAFEALSSAIGQIIMKTGCSQKEAIFLLKNKLEEIYPKG